MTFAIRLANKELLQEWFEKRDRFPAEFSTAVLCQAI